MTRRPKGPRNSYEWALFNAQRSAEPDARPLCQDPLRWQLALARLETRALRLERATAAWRSAVASVCPALADHARIDGISPGGESLAIALSHPDARPLWSRHAARLYALVQREVPELIEIREVRP